MKRQALVGRVVGTLAIVGMSILLSGAAPGPVWRDLDPENTLVIETSKGRIVVEMTPALAPLAVARVKRLAREGVYDGLLFHRVIEGFVDQTGNPNNHDGGTSRYPNLPAEFTARLGPDAALSVILRRNDAIEGFLGATPVEGGSDDETRHAADHRVRVWGAYCDGVAGMGRQADVDTANSEIFFMRAPARRLDHDYAVWGRVVEGLDVVRAIQIGEPPTNPDRMIQVRVASDLPADQRRLAQAENTQSAAFLAKAARLKAKRGASFTLCDVPIASRSP